MDQHKFVTIVKQFPQIWERSHSQFRDKDAKDSAWDTIGSQIGCTGEACKEMFKSIREKYIREKEKCAQYGKDYREWELLSELSFLDPNIVPRKQSGNNNEDIQKAEEICSQINVDASLTSFNQTSFDKVLIEVVKKTTPIWDRNCNTYANKQLKNQLWQNIATKLNSNVNTCTLRWKALREKYIRQKMKYQQEGDKWELLDDMKFLDKVIQYRKKHSDLQNKTTNNEYSNLLLRERKNEIFQENNSNISQNTSSSEIRDDISIYDSSNDGHTTVKEESTILQIPDSSYNIEFNGVSRKRSISINSEASREKIFKGENSVNPKEKTPEEIFGDLVAVMLSKKPENHRNLYMIEIMKVLSK